MMRRGSMPQTPYNALVLPYHDPDGIVMPYLFEVNPDLRELYTRAFLSVSPATEQRQPEALARLAADPFFVLNSNDPGSLPGEHYRAGMESALREGPEGAVIHIADIDRVAFALLNGYHEAFTADVRSASRSAEHSGRALLFQRSPVAWATHPENYREIEAMLIRVGEMLFDRYIDFGWSYLIVPAALLHKTLPRAESRDFALLIELLLLLEEWLDTRDVDWLAWEDPFILRRDPAGLRQERSASREETIKRLRGLLPFFQQFLRHVPELNTRLAWEKGTPARE